jgi:hypothetical protein
LRTEVGAKIELLHLGRVRKGGAMADDACSVCGREEGSLRLVPLDTGEQALFCPDCLAARGDDLLVPGVGGKEAAP